MSLIHFNNELFSLALLLKNNFVKLFLLKLCTKEIDVSLEIFTFLINDKIKNS